MTRLGGKEISPHYYFLYRFLWRILDWIFPPRCGGCGQADTRWCHTCNQKVVRIIEPLCHICGKPLEASGTCLECQTHPPHYAGLRSWGRYNQNLRLAIHRLKYRGDISLGDVLSVPMIEMLKELPWKIDLVSPVPIGLVRRAKRGYNQSALLAFPIALKMGIDYQPKSIIKIRDTTSQVGLSKEQRKENVMGAFRSDERWVKDRVVLVVDDVVTSGATIEACARSLKEANAAEVYGLTLARAWC